MHTTEKRTSSIRIRLSESERNAISQRKPRTVSMAEWLRSLAIGEKPRLIKTRLSPDQLDALRHLSWIGNNLNQLTKCMNIAALERHQIEQACTVLDKLSEIARDIRQIREVVEQ